MNDKVETSPFAELFVRELCADAPAALAETRTKAFARFEVLGLPTRRDEAWRYTDLRPLQGKAYLPPHSDPLPVGEREGPARREGEGALRSRLEAYALEGKTHRLVVVNNHLASELSMIGVLPQGATLSNTAKVVVEDPRLALALFDWTDIQGGQAFASLNAALFHDGFVLTLADGVTLDHPVEIIHWNDGNGLATHSRSLILMGANARATVVETFIGEGDHWSNAVTRVDLGAGAALRHVKIQDESATAIHFGQVRAELARNARYESFVLTLGGRLARHDSFVKYTGEDAACGLFGAYLLRGEQEATNATFVEHAVPRCTTKEVFKGVVDERAHGVFLGKIAVRPQAQKTDAHQLNKNLLLSPRAAVDTKPELEILADDVKCSHGATVGDLDEEALFYLEARGIPALEARHMLIEAFAADAIDQIEDDGALRAYLKGKVEHWLARGIN